MWFAHQQIHKVDFNKKRGNKASHVFIMRPHAATLSSKKRQYPCTISLSILSRGTLAQVLMLHVSQLVVQPLVTWQVADPVREPVDDEDDLGDLGLVEEGAVDPGRLSGAIGPGVRGLATLLIPSLQADPDFLGYLSREHEI